MDNQQDSQAQPAEPGYETAGRDTIIHSAQDDLPSPTETSNERISQPKPVIRSINEKPGDANPALGETIAAEKGEADTADMLRAREAAEEQPLRRAGAQIYQDQPPDAEPEPFEQQDTGRPNWPDDRQEPPMEKMESPHADAPYLAGSPDLLGLNWKGRVDDEMDRNAEQAAPQESRSGLDASGDKPEEAKIERLEMDNPTPQSDMDRSMPGMINLPPEDTSK